MDITKVTADILDGPNWGTWAVQIQAAARVLNCWSVMKGERIAGVSPPTYDLLLKPVHGNAAGQISDLALFTKSLSEWNKMNSTALRFPQHSDDVSGQPCRVVKKVSDKRRYTV